MIFMVKRDVRSETIIDERRTWFFLDGKSLLGYRDLLFLMVRREWVAKYKQTLLGPFWFLLQPLLLTSVFSLVFGKIIRVPTQGIPMLSFYLCGLLPWAFFSQCLNSISNCLVDQAPLFAKVYFPRLIIPLSLVLSHLMTFLIQVIFFLGVSFSFSPRFLMLPFCVLHTALLGSGVGLLFSAMTAKYRDLKFLLGFLTQVWMYGTPIVYPLTLVPEKWRWISEINPLTAVIEEYRHFYFGTPFVIHPQMMALSILFTLFVFLTGLLMFNRVQETFVDFV
ncbi:MAG: ABC transporter permease [Chlamydiae bacterium]|nr:ABC transporter permease [Chlamydiota bacterium]MBI3267251.1 ABC transporter permease [Chlamydiota bacterium]